jgi:two-component system response regulator FixJ
MTHHTLCLLDVDSRRRAAIAYSLSGSGIHAEPFENVSELLEYGPRPSEVIMAHDEGNIIADLVDRLGRSGTWSPIVAYRETPEVQRVVCTMQTGADDYMAWPFSAAELTATIDRAVTHGNCLRAYKSRQIAARARLERLTTRERQVLTGLVDGLTNRSIGEGLNISPRTVEIHRSNLLNKTQARHSSEVIRLAIEANLSFEN